MKKLLIILVAVFATLSATSCSAYGRKDVHINLNEIHSNAMLKQFMKAKKLNQLEIMQRLYREANDAYYAAENLDQLYVLREDVKVLQRKYILMMNKESMGEIENSLNILQSKIDRSIRDAENDNHGTHGGSTYSVFGQELD
jgi:hypothetical protein